MTKWNKKARNDVIYTKVWLDYQLRLWISAEPPGTFLLLPVIDISDPLSTHLWMVMGGHTAGIPELFLELGMLGAARDVLRRSEGMSM